jgi:hypothetical protein
LARTKSEPYVRVADQARAGTLELIDPLDYLILDKLPKEGTTMGGIIPLGLSARDLAATALKGVLEGNAVGGRLTMMKMAGLATDVRTLGHKQSGIRGWQITSLGEKYLADWKSTRKEKNE